MPRACLATIPGGLRRIAAVVVAATVCLAVAAPAHAQRRRGPSPAQRAAMQKMQKQMKAYQADVQRYQKEMADKQAEVAKQYDENGDGRLFGPEKSKYDKYMFEVQKGRQPNPFAGILPPGQGSAMAAAKK